MSSCRDDFISPPEFLCKKPGMSASVCVCVCVCPPPSASPRCGLFLKIQIRVDACFSRSRYVSVHVNVFVARIRELLHVTDMNGSTETRARAGGQNAVCPTNLFAPTQKRNDGDLSTRRHIACLYLCCILHVCTFAALHRNSAMRREAMILLSLP
jgi:hypothetical protein